MKTYNPIHDEIWCTKHQVLKAPGMECSLCKKEDLDKWKARVNRKLAAYARS